MSHTFGRIGTTKTLLILLAAALLSACRTDLVTRIQDEQTADVSVVFGAEMAAWFRENPAEAEKVAALVADVGGGRIDISDHGSEVAVSQAGVPLSAVTGRSDLTGVGGVEFTDDEVIVKFVAPQSIVEAIDAAVPQIPTRETMYETTFVVVQVEGAEVVTPSGAAALWEQRGNQITIYRDVASLREGDEIWTIRRGTPISWGRVAVAAAGAATVVGVTVVAWRRRRQRIASPHPGDPHNVI